MKLKKIASLALAGVMAVSVLTACGGNTINNGGEGEGEGEGTTASGYSAVLAENLTGAVKDMDNVTFKDNADDVAALEDALGNFGSVAVTGAATVPATVICLDTSDGGFSAWAGMDLVKHDFIDALNFKDGDLQLADLSFTSCQKVNANVTVKDGTLFAIDGTVDVNKAVKQVAAKVNQYLNMLPENNGWNSSVTGAETVRYDYNYTVSVSVVNKALAPFAGYTLSANFIAVTVTRVPTAA